MKDAETNQEFIEFMNDLVSCYVVTQFAHHLRIFNQERERNGKDPLAHIDAELLLAKHPPVVKPPADFEDVSEQLAFKQKYLDSDWEA